MIIFMVVLFINLFISVFYFYSIKKIHSLPINLSIHMVNFVVLFIQKT